MDDQPTTHGSPDIVQAPDDVPEAAASDPRATRAAPAETIAGTSIFVGLVGIWLLLSPVALNYGSGDSAVNVIVVGALALAIAVLGFMRIEPRLLDRVVLGLGIWLAASAAWLADSSSVRVDSLLMGIILAVLALVGLAAYSDRGRSGSFE